MQSPGVAKKLWLLGILIALPLGLAVCGRIYRVPTASMAPTIPKGSFVLAYMRAYKSKAPARLDVVVYATTKKGGGEDQRYVGRVIGLPGEAVEVDKSGVKINGSVMTAPSKILYRSYEKGLGRGPDFQSVILKADEYYILGDNPDESFDCRFFGPVQKSAILGRVININGKSVKP